jgi:hypothetical protein
MFLQLNAVLFSATPRAKYILPTILICGKTHFENNLKTVTTALRALRAVLCCEVLAFEGVLFTVNPHFFAFSVGYYLEFVSVDLISTLF